MNANETIAAIKKMFGTFEIADKKKGTFDTPAPDPKTGKPQPSTDKQSALEERVATLEAQVAELMAAQTLMKSDQSSVKMKLGKHEAAIPNLFRINEELIKEQEELAKKLPHNGPKVWKGGFFNEVAEDKKRVEDRLKKISAIAENYRIDKS